MQHEMHRPEIRELPPVHSMARILVAQQFLDLRDRQQAAEPVLLVRVPHKQPHVRVGGFVPRPAVCDVAQGSERGGAEGGEIAGVGHVRGGLVGRVLFRDSRRGDVDCLRVDVDSVLDQRLLHQGDVILIVDLREALPVVQVEGRGRVGDVEGVDARAEEVLGADELSRARLREDAEVHHGGLLGERVGGDGAIGLEFEAVEVGRVHPFPDLSFKHRRLLLHVQADHDPVHLSLVAPDGGEANPGGWWRRHPAYPAQSDAVLAGQLEFGVGDLGGDVRVDVPRPLDLVHELAGAGLRRHLTHQRRAWRQRRYSARSCHLLVLSGIGYQLFEVHLYRPQNRQNQDHSPRHRHILHRRRHPERFVLLWPAYRRSAGCRPVPGHGYLYVCSVPTGNQYRCCL